ncbi:inosine monophosphate dehydrogenase, partial [Aureobasidium sp. EXF-3399]
MLWIQSSGFLAPALGGAGAETLKKMGAGDPEIVGPFIMSVLQGARDADVGKVITKDGIQECDVTKIWIRIGSITRAIQLVQSCKPDVLVLQGADAGGHGGEKGAGIISVIPETLQALQNVEIHDVSIVAAGGIADGSGVAAALTLGADGIVMGTRFLAAEETTVHPAYRTAVLETEDGGQTTVRAKLFDELAGPNIWSRNFDGRALIAQSYRDHMEGIPIDDIRKSHAEAKQSSHLGFDQENRRAAIWAGTGVGLVREKAPAAEIVTEVRESARAALKRTVSLLAKF